MGHVDAALDEAALGQLVKLMPQRQGDSVVLESFPRLAQGQPGFLIGDDLQINPKPLVRYREE